MVLNSSAPHLLLYNNIRIQFRRSCLLFSSSSEVSSESESIESETLVSSVVSILKEQRSKSRWNFIKTSHPHGFSPKQVSEITLRIRNNPRLALRFFLWSEKKSLCTHDIFSYATIIHILARSRLKTLAQTLIQTAIRVSEENRGDDIEHSCKPPMIFETLIKTYRRCDSAPFVFDLLIRACLQAKRIDQTIEIVRMLRSRGISPTIGTCNLMIRSISQVNGPDAGLSMYREIFSLAEEDIARKNRTRVFPNLQTYNTLMLAFYQDGMLGKVEEIWTEMVGDSSFGFLPNVCSYSILLAAFCDQGNMVKTMKLWEEMQMNGIKPDATAYNTLIKGLCENKTMEKAEAIFREMLRNQIEATCLTFEHLINGYCKVGDVDSAVLWYKDLCRMEDFTLEAHTTEVLIGAMCDKNRTLDAMILFRDSIKKHNFCPSRACYQYLIRGLCEEAKLEDAMNLQREMVGNGFEPNSEIYNIFISAYNKEGNAEKLKNLQKEMPELFAERM